MYFAKAQFPLNGRKYREGKLAKWGNGVVGNGEWGMGNGGNGVVLINSIITNLLIIQFSCLKMLRDHGHPPPTPLSSLLLPLALALCTSPTGESTALALCSAAETQGRWDTPPPF